MKVSELAKYFDRLEKTSSRIEITKILAELFSSCGLYEIDKVVYLSLGILAPSFRGIVFNLAERMMVRVIALAYSEAPEKVLEKYKALGDLGNVAYGLAKNHQSSL